MDTNGIRIHDSVGDYLSVTLLDILDEVLDAEKYKWAILFLNGMPNEGQGRYLIKLQESIENSHRCLKINWNEILKISDIFFQLYEIVIIGCIDDKRLKNYNTDQEMFESCDIVIVLIDRNFWEVSSKNPKLIELLKLKFKHVEPLSL